MAWRRCVAAALLLVEAAAAEDRPRSAPLPVDLCRHDHQLCGLSSFSGFVPVPGAGSLFYWYFEAEHRDPAAPLVLWLQGGPGASSMLGNFFEIGPVSLDESGKLARRPSNETWAARLPVLFVDSPVGTGWSYAEADGYARSQLDVARVLGSFLEGFAALHPEAPSSLVLAGESYGGHYIPALGTYLLDHRGHFTLDAVAIGDGLTDPPTQVLTKPQEAYAFGLLDERQLAQAEQLAREAHDLAMSGDLMAAVDRRSALEGFVKNASAINLYDVRTTEPYDWQDERMAAFFGRNATKDLLHVPRTLSFGTSPEVYRHLKGDVMRSQKGQVDRLLGAGVRVLLYQGQFDWKDGVVSNEAWIRTLSWNGTAPFLASSRSVWRRAADGRVAGYWKRWRNLEQAVVLGAGHMVPMNQPLSAVDMITRFLGSPDRHGRTEGEGFPAADSADSAGSARAAPGAQVLV